MANSWFRVWTDMVNDPKWRTIARVSKQKIGDVLGVYMHMLTLAANATERGRTEGFNDEDIATALDIDTEQVTAIREAMQGRVLDDDRLTGWEKRQPQREDGSADRGRSFRERKAAEKQAQAAISSASERTRTQPNATERQIREEEIREELTPSTPDGVDVASGAGNPVAQVEKSICPHQDIIALYHEVLPQCPRVRDWTPARATQLRARWNEDESRQNLGYWRRFFEYVATCDFLVGKQAGGGRPFMADLEWLTKSSNFTKVRERKYE
ncbi:hypothetical protein LE190_16085 [Massilia oculi]|uniref:Phage replisome organizer n=1 Tax=Massilia hydrophila TaxID=3044279 RepID=A0ABS7YCL1_9BURK|nr:hypothetical protein [Massilia oculi]MCA1857433.1 hypothetical protein [Massilia oculi]